MQIIQPPTNTYYPLQAVLCVLAMVCALCLFSLNAHADEAAIGRVTLVIGQAQAINAQKQRRDLQRDDAIYLGDTLETQEGAHLHLRFIDNGLVSLRPSSRLLIEQYKVDEAHPNNTAIRLKLDSGVVRSISGEATEAAHHRFRLNTPITAIGVLGTDFLVRADADKTWAAVYSGAIAISLLSESCSPSGLGACAGATQLSERMGGVMIEFDRNHRQRIAPQNTDILSQDRPAMPLDIKNTGINNLNDAIRLTANELNGNGFSYLFKSDSTDPPVKITEVSPFAWGRWFGTSWQGDTLSQDYALASANRQVTVGTDNYALFRDSATANQALPSIGRFEFTLAQSNVFFIEKTYPGITPTSIPATLTAANLQIDFAQRVFSSHLVMNAPSVGSATQDLSGKIADSGIFAASNTSGLVAGAVSAQGGHVGLLFKNAIDSGTFTGITNWSR
jgi:hypothetical protein